MLIFFAKYTLFMCLLLNLGNNQNCENKLSDASTGRGVYQTAACIAKCVLREKDKNFEKCNDFCQSKKDNNTILKKINENHDLVMICRDDRSLTLRVILPAERLANIPNIIKDNGLHPPHHHQQQSRHLSFHPNSTKTIQEIYVINVSLDHDAEEINVYLSNEHFITIENLHQNTTYNISVVAVYSSDEYSIITKGKQFTTLRRGYKPKEIPDEISLLRFDADESDEMRVTALISWSPSSDMTCHYDLICYSPDREDMELTPVEIRNPQSLYSYTLDNLTFATLYHVGIRAKNTIDLSKESELTWKMIKTPSCIEWHHNNFNICAPLQPEELFVEEHFLAANEFSLNISWKHPKFEPDYYTLRILDLDQLNTYGVKSHVVNVTKDQNWYFIPTLTLKGMMYETHLTAFTPGGSSTAVVTLPTKMLVSDKNYVLKLLIAILAPIFCITILSLVVFIVCHRRAKLKRYQERCKYFEELEKKAPIDPKSTFDFPTKSLSVPPSQDDLHQFQLDLEEKLFFNDDMEVNRSDVTLYEVLGEGAFGLVRRGIFHETKTNDGVVGSGDGGARREVAVKMLKDQPSVDDVRAFRREIEVMKSVGRHPNIVGIIGHCTRKYNEMLLLTEYCSFGNLLNFLRNEWKYLHELSFYTPGDPLIPPEPPHIQQRQHQQQQQQYPVIVKKHRKLSDSVFNFDSSIVEKIKMKYKNINSTSSMNGTPGYVGSPDSGGGPLSPPPPASVPAVNGHQKKPQQLAEFNKSYGYDEICTNACKCRVDILANDVDVDSPATTNTSNETTQKCGQIKISNKCECRIKRRRNLLSLNNESYYKNLSTRTKPSVNGNTNHSTEERILNGSIPAKREPLKATDLLDIAKQVAMGMEFLSKNKVVHRDLAARNVLVSSDRTVKIADFGLSRDVYQENVYKKTGNGKLPIKWLALESMTHQVYTSQSDVWSYGILLYEIATLGGIPYPSIPTNRLLHLLKTGYRMEKPRNCGHEFYSLMNSCWHSNPVERPNFTEIIKIIDCLMCESPQLQIEKPFMASLKNSPDTPTSDDSYLKPL